MENRIEVRRPSAVKPKRIRLNKKQRWFMGNIFEGEQTIEEALETLHIRPRTLARWLTRPKFIEELEVRMTQFHLQSRLEIARCAPHAVGGLGFLCKEKSVKAEAVRKACGDLLKLQHEYQTLPAGAKAEKKGAKSDQKGAKPEQFGVLAEQNGVKKELFGNTKKAPNPHCQLKIVENR